MAKAQSSLTKTGILFVIIIFYAFITIMIAYFFGLESNNIYSTEEKTFFSLVITGFTGLGWLNAVIFTPLLLVIAWIILSSLPTINGGG